MNKPHLHLHPAYKIATIEHIATVVPSPNQWGPSTPNEVAAQRDIAAAFDGAGCDMSIGGLSDDEVFQSDWFPGA